MIARDIANDLNSFIQQCGGANEDWYIGIAFDAEYTLFNDHKVSRHFDSWIYRIADNSDIARSVESAYLTSGFDGGHDGVEAVGSIVYAYLKSAHTQP
jgi:hypothetical protein